MSVVGLDVGNINCFVAVARAGGIETVDNEYSDRCTPSIVAFNNLQRLIGVSAKNQMVMNLKATISQFKRLIGRKFDEPAVQEELKRHPNNFLKKDNGDIGIEVLYRGEKTVFSAVQIMAMLLSQLKTIAHTNLKNKITDCVISVPSFFTDYQRRCFLRAAEIAGLNCLKLMNDTSAVALNYGLFKQDLPAAGEAPRLVAFVDCGQSSFQVCIAAFNKGKIKVLASACDENLGGRDFDDRLKNYFADAFMEKYKLDARSSPKAMMRLSAQIEKIKMQMSSNSTDLPFNIECFMNDIDVSHKINRSQFEEMSQNLLDRVEAPLLLAIEESGLKLDEIDYIELVGGSTRIPAMQAHIERVFGKIVSTTLNLNEAVARGCAIQCAMLSHTVKVRDIEVMDAASYPITISWDSVKPDEPPGEMEVFKKHHSYPFTKMLTFPHRVDPFRFRAYYTVAPASHSEREIGEFFVNAVIPSENSEKVKVKVKLRLDIHGCFTVSSATQVENLPPPEKEEPMETSELPNGEVKPAESNTYENMQEDTEPTDATQKEEEKTEQATKEKSKEPEDDKKEEMTEEAKKPKKATKSTDLIVTKNQVGLMPSELNLLIEIENELVSTVRLEKQRADVKNAVEEYVYDMREKINDLYENNISESDRETFCSLLGNTEDWLYEDGEDQNKQVYLDKLSELKKLGQPVVDRHAAHEGLPSAFESLGGAITHFRKILDLYNNKDEKYTHIEEAEMKKVSKKVDEKFNWFNEKMQENAKCALHVTPSVYPSQIRTEKKLFEDFCKPIVSKPKPKVEPPKQDKVEPPKEDKKDQTTETEKDAPETGKDVPQTGKDIPKAGNDQEIKCETASESVEREEIKCETASESVEREENQENSGETCDDLNMEVD